MTPKQITALLAFAARGNVVLGTKRCPVNTLQALHRQGLVRPTGTNANPYTGVWELTETGCAKVADLITVTKEAT